MAQLTVNSAELYYEVRGAGPPVLLIMGFTGDSGHGETLAELLADEFTVVSYDRRGNGRSPRPRRLGNDLRGGAGRRRGGVAELPWPCARRGLWHQRRRELRPLPAGPPP
jgi:pimeloyl-ACP methyl ester carboxylesterase